MEGLTQRYLGRLIPKAAPEKSGSMMTHKTFHRIQVEIALEGTYNLASVLTLEGTYNLAFLLTLAHEHYVIIDLQLI
jgi:hypothetical protein